MRSRWTTSVRSPLLRRLSTGGAARLNFYDLDFHRVSDLLTSLQWPAYSASQLWEAVYARGLAPEGISTLSRERRAQLTEMFRFDGLRIEHEAVSSDGTIKWLMTSDRDPTQSDSSDIKVETVYIPDGDRGTLCVSSQAGCSLACSFCHTGTQRLQRNLSAGEIAGQVLAARQRLLLGRAVNRATPRAVDNVVLMGQGEPGYNPTRVLTALRILTAGHSPARDVAGIQPAPKLSAFTTSHASLPAHHVMISTAGVAPFIARLGKEPAQYRLAVSLHAPNDELRTAIMPINKTYPLQTLMLACAEYVSSRIALLPRPGNAAHIDERASLPAMQEWLQAHGDKHNGPRRVRVSFEYVLLRGINDSRAHACELADLLGSYLPLQAVHVNLLTFNKWPGAPYEAATLGAAIEFQAALRASRIHVTTRTSRGADVLGACGQLKSSLDAKVEGGLHRGTASSCENGNAVVASASRLRSDNTACISGTAVAAK